MIGVMKEITARIRKDKQIGLVTKVIRLPSAISIACWELLSIIGPSIRPKTTGPVGILDRLKIMLNGDIVSFWS